MLRQNEQHEQIEIMAKHGPLCKRIKMIKVSHAEEIVNVKCAFLKSFSILRDCFALWVSQEYLHFQSKPLI